MSSVVVVKAFLGTVDTVELHSSEESAWKSLRDYVGAPQSVSLDDWWEAWTAFDPPAWYNHTDYGDCRVLHSRAVTPRTEDVAVFEQSQIGGGRR